MSGHCAGPRQPVRNFNRRIQAAVTKCEGNEGTVVDPIHAIGPHEFRAVIYDSEGNQVAFHSEPDA